MCSSYYLHGQLPFGFGPDLILKVSPDLLCPHVTGVSLVQLNEATSFSGERLFILVLSARQK